MRGVTAALVLGSILPDVDGVLVPRGFEVYLRAHASGTHSCLGAFAEALALAVTLHTFVRGSHFVRLLAGASIGTFGHIFWDLANGSDMHVLQPFSNRVFGWHLISMGEPVVLAILAAAVFFAWRHPQHAQQMAVVTIVALVAVLALKVASQVSARGLYTEALHHDAPQAIEVAPVMGRLFVWTIYDRAGDRVRAYRVDSRLRTTSLAFEYRDAPSSPAVERARQLPVVQTFLRLPTIPFVRIEHEEAHGLVLWSDVRACSMSGCNVSFGGAFDEAGAPLYQLIEVGGFRFTRPIPVDQHDP
jgi:membrane-bound metal-dependent hydrolase YbcI (DUF457 family)